MKLSLRAFTVASAVIWGGAVFLVSAVHHCCPGYGGSFLDLIASIYPGYRVDGGLISVLFATAYAIVDGGIAGALLAWIYNRAAP